ncbi:hypothetical protein DY000_02020455 [Brassica cretica]|uniref:Retropepsins domain-containing protein n=1 Tax=Brassica cretica TaxID=69181 RepID=A0ABQ7E3X4_BRACR|nr:hypothetical protein DY000_02020455 [Brassica cretica]
MDLVNEMLDDQELMVSLEEMVLDAAAGATEEGLITDEDADNIAKSEVVGETEKTKRAKKKLYKNIQAVGGNSKKRLVQALTSPRKRNQAKGTSKIGEGAKQVEEQKTDLSFLSATTDPIPIRSDCIESIDLDLFRSRRPITSRKVDLLDKRTYTSRGAINGSTIIAFEDAIRKGEIVTFHEHETIKLDMPHDGALVIALEFEGTVFSKILVDTGSAVDIISQKTLRSLEQPIPVIRQETSVRSLGIILLTTRACDLELRTEFTAVDHPMPFDAVVGRPWLHQMRAVPSVYHQCVKFLSPTGEKTILGNQKQTRACYMSEFRKMPQKEENISLARFS